LGAETDILFSKSF